MSILFKLYKIVCNTPDADVPLVIHFTKVIKSLLSWRALTTPCKLLQIFKMLPTETTSTEDFFCIWLYNSESLSHMFLHVIQLVVLIRKELTSGQFMCAVIVWLFQRETFYLLQLLRMGLNVTFFLPFSLNTWKTNKKR